jgi:hypothetical protein
MLRTSGVLGGQLARLFGAGAANTIATFALLQALLLVLPSTLAYLIAWLAGLAIVVIFYPRTVFGQSATSWQRRMTYGGIYLGIFLSGLLLLRYFVDGMAWTPHVAATVVVTWTAAASYVCRSWLFGGHVTDHSTKRPPISRRPHQAAGSNLLS